LQNFCNVYYETVDGNICLFVFYNITDVSLAAETYSLVSTKTNDF